MELFEDLSDYMISVFRENPKSASHLPAGHVIIATSHLWKGLEWEHQSFIADCEAMGPLPWAGDELDLESEEEFVVRSTMHLLSYINGFSVLDGIVWRAFHETVKLGNGYFPEAYVPDAVALDANTVSVDLLVRYRNKMAAHTCFADPRKGDSEADQLNSLLNIGGSCGFTNKDRKTFHIGGSQVVLNGQAEPDSIFAKQLSIVDAHALATSYFASWHEQFVTMMGHFRKQCPFQSAVIRCLAD